MPIPTGGPETVHCAAGWVAVGCAVEVGNGVGVAGTMVAFGTVGSAVAASGAETVGAGLRVSTGATVVFFNWRFGNHCGVSDSLWLRGGLLRG